ncbi:MAG: hypothetical protein RR847_00795 [Bacilli bacterium]
MGLLDKVKNMFTEEIEETEVPVKKEVMQVEIESPRVGRSETISKREINRDKEILNEITFKSRDKDLAREMIEEIKQEPKTPSPIYFEDKDFRELEKPKQKQKKQIAKKEVYGGNKPIKETVKKAFKPTPIISPVYGILDKNYQKEEIVNKKENSYCNPNKSLTIDEVRKKAYGTLENQLEENLFTTNTEITGNTEILEDLIIDVKEQLSGKKATKIKDNLDHIEDELNNLEGTLVEISKMPLTDINSGEQQENQKELTLDNEIDELNKSLDDEVVNENDLFDLIDSMYEKKDDE